jgi:hypothetical protein
MQWKGFFYKKAFCYIEVAIIWNNFAEFGKEGFGVMKARKYVKFSKRPSIKSIILIYENRLMKINQQ